MGKKKGVGALGRPQALKEYQETNRVKQVEDNLKRPATRSISGEHPCVAHGMAVLVFVLLIFTRGFASGSTNRPAERLNRPTGAGINYRPDEVPDVPWSIHRVQVDRSRTDLYLETTLGGIRHLGMGLVSDQVKQFPTNLGRPLAAVNGDFYRHENKYPGDPQGLQISRGELVSGPDDTRSCFWVDAAGELHITNVLSRFTVTWPDGGSAPFDLNEKRSDGAIVLYTSAKGFSTKTSGGVELILKQGGGTNWLPLAIGQTYTARVEKVHTEGDSLLTPDMMVLSVSPKAAALVAKVKVGDTVTISTATMPSLTGASTAIGGGPALVHGRKTTSFRGLQPRHPRTALGWNKQYFFLVEVDGRQKTSAGMTFPELATYMLNLGCDEAMNLDGGGSATMWVYGNVMNSPSEGHERPAANALIVVRKNAD